MAIKVITGEDFVRGESVSDNLNNGGFSPASKNINLARKPGMLYFNPSTTDRGGATLTGNIIASTYDKNLSGNDGYFLDDDGAFYTISGATFTKRQTAAADTFQLGTSDILQFKGETYATSQTRVVNLTGSDLATLDSSWWTGLSSGVRHPLERVEDKMYIGDGNLIHTVTDSSTTTGSAITLPTDVNITSLRKHPNGRNLIAFCGLTQDFSHTRGTPGRIYLIDVELKDWIREIDVEAQVEGSRNVGGTIYVTYGKEVGFFSGDGITSLNKRLDGNVSTTTTYSHNLSNLEDFLLVRDGTDVLAFGDLGAGRVWWRLFNNTGGEKINNIHYKGDNKLLVAYADGSAGDLVEIDYDSAGSIGTFVSDRYTFGSKAHIKQIDIVHDISNTTGTTSFSVRSRDTDDSEDVIESVTYNSQGANVTRIKCDIKTHMFQLNLVPSSDDIGYKMIIIYYDNIK